MSPTHRRRPWLVGLGAAASLALGTAGLSACGGSASTPVPVDDAADRKKPLPLPEWFPAQFPAPTGGVIVDVIDKPETGAVIIGRTVTWRVDRSYGDVLRGIDDTLRSIGWRETQRLATEEEADSKRTSIYVENGIVEVIRVFADANLKGTRVAVELPA